MNRGVRAGALAVLLLWPAQGAGQPAAVPPLPPGWTDQPAIAARAAEAAAAAGLALSVQAAGETSIGVFGIHLSGEASGRIRAGDVLDAFRAQAAAASIELRDPVNAVLGQAQDERKSELRGGLARGRWRGDLVIRTSTGIELHACFHGDRKPEQAAAQCRAFLAAAEAAR